MKNRAAIAASLCVLSLTACSGMQPQEPAQPTPQSIQSTLTQLAGITADPVTAWKAGDYAVRAACHAYLNAAAQRSSGISLAGAAVGFAGAAGSMVNPLAGVASSLLQGFLSAYQQSGAIPWGPETATIIENALDAYEDGVAASPPATVEDAASDVDTLWFYCSPGGYSILVTKAISTAGISASASPSLSPTARFNSAAAATIIVSGRPKVLVNGH